MPDFIHGVPAEMDAYAPEGPAPVDPKGTLTSLMEEGRAFADADAHASKMLTTFCTTAHESIRSNDATATAESKSYLTADQLGEAAIMGVGDVVGQGA